MVEVLSVVAIRVILLAAGGVGLTLLDGHFCIVYE